MVAPSLFDFTRDGNEEGFAADVTNQFVRRLVGWMAGGHSLELALLTAPRLGCDHPQSLALAKWLEPCLASGHLKLWKVPASFDALNWPRLILNPGKDSSRCLFTRAGLNTSLLKQPLVLPLWRSPSLSTSELGKLRANWQLLPNRLTEPGSKTTLYEYKQGDARNLTRDFAFCSGKKLSSAVRVAAPQGYERRWHRLVE